MGSSNAHGASPGDTMSEIWAGAAAPTEVDGKARALARRATMSSRTTCCCGALLAREGVQVFDVANQRGEGWGGGGARLA
jgi:hypothetical protein